MSSFQLNKAFPLTSAFHTGQEIQPCVSFRFGALDVPFKSVVLIWFFFCSHDICTFHGCFPSANGDQSEVPIFFLFILLFSTQQLKKHRLYIYVSVYAFFGCVLCFSCFCRLATCPLPGLRCPHVLSIKYPRHLSPPDICAIDGQSGTSFLSKSNLFAHHADTGRADHTAASWPDDTHQKVVALLSNQMSLP